MHCYVPPMDLPRGVEVFDASRLLPENELLRHKKSGSVSLGSNRYRYLLIEGGMGLYADCDMFCLKELKESDYVIGREETERVNGAILHYPPGSALSKLLLEATASPYNIPPGLSNSRAMISRLRKLIGLPRSVETHRWGVWGPELLTHAVSSLGLWKKTSPVDAFYPVHYRQTQLLFEPSLNVKDITTSRTIALHLWQKLSEQRTPDRNTPLYEILNS